MEAYPYGQYVYPNGTQMPSAQQPVRYMVPPGYRQQSPPFANQSFNQYAAAPPRPTPPLNMVQPRYPAGYVQPAMTMPPATVPQQTSYKLQPPEPYYYNPYGSNQETPSITPGPKTPASTKTGAKEYKDKAFTIAPDGVQNETIKGLVSNNNINDLLKHKGTKVKVSKIYRITKTKPDVRQDSSSDDDVPLTKPLPKTQQPPPAPVPVPEPEEPQRSSSSSSSCSHCSTCSNCSCTDCRHRYRSHSYDDCPECRAEWEQDRSRHRRRR